MKQEEIEFNERRKGQIMIFVVILILFVICILGIQGVFALDIYPGQNFTISGLDYAINYTIDGNLSEINISLSNGTAYVQIPTDYVPSSFNITLYGFNGQGETVYVGSGGGGSSGGGTVYIQNKTIQYVDVPRDVQKIVEKEKNNTIYLNNSSPPSLRVDQRYWVYVIAIVIFIILVIIILSIYQSIRRKRFKEFDGFEDMPI